MNEVSLYPLRFNPIYQYRLWGGRRLANLVSAPLPGDGPIGKAWLLSDREDHPSRVAEGPLKGRSIGQLLKLWPEQLLGKVAGRFHRFPLPLRFLDVRDALSVQVHPPDQQTQYIPTVAGDAHQNTRRSFGADSGGARRRRLCHRQSRCAALAGRGRSVFVPTA